MRPIKEARDMDRAYFPLYLHYLRGRPSWKAYELLEEAWLEHEANTRQGQRRYKNYETFRVMLHCYHKRRREVRS